MGKMDIRTREYVRDARIFADICNYKLFDGEQIIKPEQLTQKDPGELIMPFKEGDISIPIQKFRDVMKTVQIKASDKATFIVVGVENQSEINYAMVIRNMLYDAINYSSQIDEIAKKNRKSKSKKTSAEFLSGMRKNDKIKPVITIVVYWGMKKWDGACSIHEMVDAEEALLRYIPDYHMNLVSPNEIEDFTKFHTDVGLVLECLKCASDRDSLRNMINTKKKDFSEVNRSTAELITELTDIRINMEHGEGSGKVDMCKAFEELLLESREEGIEQGMRLFIIDNLEEGVSEAW